MKWQSTAILATATLAVGAYIGLIEVKQDAPPADGSSVYLWDMSDAQADPIDKIVATEGTQSVTYIKLPPPPAPKPKPGTTPDPLATPAQPSWRDASKSDLGLTYMWNSTWGDLKKMQADRIVAHNPGPADKEINDFSSPSVSVTLYQGKKELYAVTVGKKTLSGQGYYARRSDSPTLYEIAGYKVDNLKKLVEAPPVASPTPAPTPTPTPGFKASLGIKPKAADAATGSGAAALKLPGEELGRIPAPKKP